MDRFHFLPGSPWILLLLVSIFCVPLSGCGSGTYNRRMEEQIDLLRRTGKFGTYLHGKITQIPETGVSLRVPRLFGSTSRTLDENSRNVAGLKMDIKRYQPPFTVLPGFRYSHEVFVPAREAKAKLMPVFCYIAVAEAKQTKQADLVKRIQKDLARQFPNAPASWQRVELDTPEGGKVEWKKMSLTGLQQFDCTPKGGEFRDYQGRFDLYLLSSGPYHVLIGWRAPQSIDADVKFFEAAEAAMGTLQIGPAP